MKRSNISVKRIAFGVGIYFILSFSLLYLLEIDCIQAFHGMLSFERLDNVLCVGQTASVLCISMGVVSFFYYPIFKRVGIVISSCFFLGGLLIFALTDMFYDSQTSKLLLSEICTNNGNIELYNSQIIDEERNYPDYIEVYNGSNFEINLCDYALSINGEAGVPLTNAVISPKSYFVIRLDGEGQSIDSLDLKLNSAGTELALISTCGIQLDTVNVPSLKVDKVYARVGEGALSEWEMSLATPGEANKRAQSSKPEFSVESGFYDDAFCVELSAEEGCTIYYTMDGSLPTLESSRYEAPILITNRDGDPNVYRAIENVVIQWNEPEIKEELNQMPSVDKCTVIRARASCDGKELSDVVTKSYFVGLQSYEQVPVVSLVAEPDDLFGDDGIYVTGKEYDEWYLGGQNGDQPFPNFRKQLEIPVYMEYFEEDEVFAQEAGLRLQGSSNRFLRDKRFSIYSRKKYSGSAYFGYNFFGYPTHSVLLRGDEADYVCQEIVASADTSVGSMTGHKVAVFLDGEFWYWSYLRPKYDEQYISRMYGVDEKSVVIEESMPGEIYEYLNTHGDLSIQENYEGFCEIVDIDNYIDYIISNIYMCNMDYNEQKNCRAWKSVMLSNSEYEDGRWRFLAYDMDCISWARVNGKNIPHKYMIDSFCEQRVGAGSSYDEDYVFSSLKENPEFRERFVKRFLDLVNTSYGTEEVTCLLDSLGIDSDWMDDFFIYRADYMIPALKRSFDLQGDLVELRLAAEGELQGEVLVNSVAPQFSNGEWIGLYYTDYPLEIMAVPSDGAEFECWKDKETGEILSYESCITLDSSELSENVYNVVYEPVFFEAE